MGAGAAAEREWLFVRPSVCSICEVLILFVFSLPPCFSSYFPLPLALSLHPGNLPSGWGWRWRATGGGAGVHHVGEGEAAAAPTRDALQGGRGRDPAHGEIESSRTREKHIFGSSSSSFCLLKALLLTENQLTAPLFRKATSFGPCCHHPPPPVYSEGRETTAPDDPAVVSGSHGKSRRFDQKTRPAAAHKRN